MLRVYSYVCDRSLEDGKFILVSKIFRREGENNIGYFWNVNINAYR